MEVLLFGIISIAVVILVFCLIFSMDSLVSYQVDRDENKDSKKITFKEFKKEFDQIKWIQDYNFKDEFTNEKTQSRIFCSEFRMNGVKYFFTNYSEWKKWNKYYKNIIQYSTSNINYAVSDKEIRNRLCNSLKNLCSQLNINVSYHDTLGDAAGRILYYSDCGRYVLDDSRIEILNEYKDEPWVLAHELGHYMAIKQRSDRTEEGADQEALKLCNSILTTSEQERLISSLNIYFKHTIKS